MNANELKTEEKNDQKPVLRYKKEYQMLHDATVFLFV